MIFPQQVEDIVLHEGCFGRGQAVEGKVFLRQCEGFGGSIHRNHLGSPAGEGIYREPASVGKCVEHPPAPRVRAHPGAVFPLVEVKAGLVPVPYIHPKRPAVFGYTNAIGRFVTVQGARARG